MWSSPPGVARMAESFDVVDVVARETADLLEGTDAKLAYGEEPVYVLEPRD